ncbi:MAG: DNA repair protein RadC [Bacteroidetes bacterium]|jgi:DNA repair protein RadC|nr:DNA repair protein RadC [Bacteroidota bacterium]
MDKKLSIKNWSSDDRPREKLLQKGTAALSDAELIAILLGSGSRDESAVELARRLLNSAANNLNELGRQTVHDLQKHKGIGEAKALTIVAALEIGRRRKISEVLEKEQISTSNDVFELMQSVLADLPYEEFWILLLNRANRIIEKIKLSQGGISGTVTDVRLILKFAIDKLASAIILCHNHPSGNIQPSHSDRNITHKLKEACIHMDINLIDHIIIGENKYYSFADEGIL